MNPAYTVPALPSHPQGAAQSLPYRQYLTDLSTSLFSFVLPLLPTAEELATKEEVRGLIERLIKTIEPSSRLASFGSSCNSFGLRNSDMDLVCLIDNKEAALHASDLVAMIGDLLERETNFEVKPLPKARIPIIKLTLNPSPGLPYGIACDIGFENRLALENTRLLLTYATIDPARIRTLVLFLKVWSKRRKINSPYRGTLSSYGFTLMVIFFLVHVKNPPVLPNLQRIAPLRPMSKEETTIDGRDVWFFDDTETLRKEWSSANFESVGELLIDFFRYYSHDFQYNNTVISIRAGHLTKESKGWMNDIDVGGLNENARDRNRLCIEDPFETPYNVARTVTKDGLYTIRGEFMRATRILTQHRDQRDRAVLALAELCMEREDELARAPRSSSPAPRSLGGGSRSGGGGFGMTGSGAGGGGWKAHMGGGGGGAPSSYDRMSSPSGGAVAAGPAGAAGMMSPNTTTTTTGPPEADDFGRRSFSHAGTKRGRQPESAAAADRHYSAQERWLAQAGLGLDGHMGAGGGGAGGMAAGGAGGYMFGLRGMGGMQDRGRDTGGGGVVVPGGSRPQPPPLDVYGIPPAARRMSGMTAGGAGHHDGSGGSSSSVHQASSGPLGSASAPISPVKQGAPLPDAHRGSSGTWSANVSPRHAHQARLPPVMDPRGPSGGGGGLQGRRVSGNAGRGAILPAGNGFDARPPQAGASSNGYGRYASPSTTSSFNHANTNNNINNGNNTTGAARRAYSVGPAQNLNYGGAQGPIPGQDSAYAVYGGGNNPQAAANNGTSPLPAFLPFGAGPSQFKSTGNGNPMYGMSPPSFISPTSLLSPESRSTPLEPYPNMYHMKGDTSAPPGAGHVGAIGTRQVATPSAPPQPHNPDRGADDNEALDALASGLKQVALGLDAGEQQTAQQQQQQSNVSATQPSSSSSSSSSSAFANMPASAGTTGSSPGNSVANIPPPRKSSA